MFRMSHDVGGERLRATRSGMECVQLRVWVRAFSENVRIPNRWKESRENMNMDSARKTQRGRHIQFFSAN